MRQPISTFNINWEGKQPGYYVRRVDRHGYITGFLTVMGGWARAATAAQWFETQEAAIKAANETGARRFDVLINQIVPRKPQPHPHYWHNDEVAK
jgi:hypothetical protein